MTNKIATRYKPVKTVFSDVYSNHKNIITLDPTNAEKRAHNNIKSLVQSNYFIFKTSSSTLILCGSLDRMVSVVSTIVLIIYKYNL